MASEISVLVVGGDLFDDGVTHDPRSFFNGPAGTVHGPYRTNRGSVLLTTFSATLDFVLAT